MADSIFENERLVAIYDEFDGKRGDLTHYISIVHELDATSILDVGCGTGSLACMLSESGHRVTGLDPARASIERARQKPHADKVEWIIGDATTLPLLKFDLALMTGNVAQLFLSDDQFEKTLMNLHRVLQPNGHLVFEVRDPAKEAWLDWTREKTYQRLEIPNLGPVEGWCDVTHVDRDHVSFRWTYVFESDSQVLTSDSTLRFRSRESIERHLATSGYLVKEVRDAPDRPGREFVFFASAIKS